MKDFFLRTYLKKTDSELEKIILDKSGYELFAREAALEILTSRNSSSLDLKKVEEEIQGENENIANRKKVNFGKGNLDNFNLNTPTLYSETLVLLLTLIFHPIFGGILLYLNFKTLKNQRLAHYALGFGMFTFALSILIQFLSQDIPIPIWLIMNIISMLIFNQLFWNNHIGRQFSYYRKPWLLTFLGIVLGIIIFSFLVGFLFAIFS